MKIGWRVYFGLLLIALSALLYLVHFDIFHDLSHIAIYGLGTSPFSRSRCFSSSLSLTGSSAGKNSGINSSKLNMVIGVYFNEVGTPLLKAFSDFDPHVGRIRDELLVKGTWKSREFADASLRLKKHEYKLVYEKDDPKAVQFLENLCSFLTRADVFCFVCSKIRTSSNRNPSPNSFGRSSTSPMSFSTDPIWRTCPTRLPTSRC